MCTFQTIKSDSFLEVFEDAQLGADPEVIEEIIYLLYVAKLQTELHVLCNFYNNKNCAAFKCFRSI